MNTTLKELRKSNKMTLSDMSKLIGLKTPSAYYKKEKGDVPFSLEEAKIIAERFNKPFEVIFFNNNIS